MAWNWKIFCSACGAITCAGLCVVTGGLTTPALLSYSAAAGGLGFLVGDKADQEAVEREKLLLQDKRYKDVNNEIGKQEGQNNQTQTSIDTIVGKLNGNIPREKNETDEYLKQQLIIHQSQLESGKKRVTELRGDLDKLRKELVGSNNLMKLLGLDKLKTTDKVMIIGGVILVIYLLKG